MKSIISTIRLAREKSIDISGLSNDQVSDSMLVNLPDGKYDLKETTWRHDIDEDGESQVGKVYDKTYHSGATVVDGCVDVHSILESVDGKRLREHYDPHIYFEGISVDDDVILVHFGS